MRRRCRNRTGFSPGGAGIEPAFLPCGSVLPCERTALAGLSGVFGLAAFAFLTVAAASASAATIGSVASASAAAIGN